MTYFQKMRNLQMDVYLNGLKMAGKRRPPYIESDKFIRAVVNDLFQLQQKPKSIFGHRCNIECSSIWTIAIGANYVEVDTFTECLPRYDILSIIETERRNNNTIN